MTYIDALTTALAPLGVTAEEIIYGDRDHCDALHCYLTNRADAAEIYITNGMGGVPATAAEAEADCYPRGTGEADKWETEEQYAGHAFDITGDPAADAAIIADMLAVNDPQNAPRYLGLWEGGAGYGDSHWGTDAVAIFNRAHAREVLTSRREGGIWQPAIRTVAWSAEGTTPVIMPRSRMLETPAVDDTSRLLLVPYGTPLALINGGDVAPDVLSFGPRGGVVFNA